MIIPLRVELLAGGIALALLTGGVAWHEHNSRLVAEGVAQEKTRVADSVLHVVVPERIRAETAFVHSTNTVTRLVTRLDTLRDSVVRHKTDTVLVDRFITVADSTARACTEALGNCATLRALLTKERDQWRVMAESAPIAQPRSCTTSNVIIGALAAAAGYFAPHPHSR